MPASSAKTNPTGSYQLYVGIDLAAATFTAATCRREQNPYPASDYQQSLVDYAQLSIITSL